LPQKSLNKTITYKVPGETNISVDRLDFSEDLLKEGTYKECMLELNINQPSANDITTLTIKRDFFLDSCQIELKPQEPNKEYHISQDLYVPMKMIFHCPKEAPAMSPTYLVVYCWD